MSERKDGLILGLGCERGTAFPEILTLAGQALDAAGAAELPLLAIVSIEGRACEPALKALARHFDCPFLCFSPETLEAETPRLANPSALVFRHVGCHGVAEAAALAAGGALARLVVPKQRSAHATAAVVQVDRSANQVVGRISSNKESTSLDNESFWVAQRLDWPSISRFASRKNPLWPAGHLPHKGGETVWRLLGKLDGTALTAAGPSATPSPPALSPLVGEMPAGRGCFLASSDPQENAEPAS